MGNQPAKQHNQIGGTKPKKFVHWKSAERPTQPGRPILIPISDQQPDVITLRWDKPKSDGGSPIIGYIVEHRRLGSPHWVRATPTLILRTEVSLSGLEPGWRYQFRTIAENVVGRSDPSDLSDALTVTLARNAISVPRFITELKDTIAVENQRVEMRVAFVGLPPPEINWFKDGFEIFSSRRTKIVNDNETSVLIIHQAALVDEGEIKCTATNRAGHIATKGKLKVEAPPKIRLPRQYEDGLIVEADEVLRLKVSIAGQPAPAVLWCHEGESIKNGGRFELITTDKYSSLKIENIKRADRGEYSIRAINKLGEDIASFLVTVTARPDPPGKVKLKMSFGRSATLTWTAPIDDGGCKIGNYIVEYFRINWNVWLKAATTRQLTATLHDLIEGSEYKFRVKAENPYGLSDPSEESDILFIPDPKRGIMKPIRKEETVQDRKPTPPRRKTLSPLRNNALDVFTNEDEREKSISGRSSPNVVNVQFIQQIYENEELHREMSYGTSDIALKRSPSGNDTKASPNQNVRKIPPNVSDAGTSPLPRRKEDNLSVNQKIQQFFKRSPSPSRKLIPTEETKESEQRKSPSPSIGSYELEQETEKRNVTVVRKNSGRFDQINQKVQQFFRRSPSPCRLDQPSEPEADQAPEFRKSPSLKRSEEPVKLNVDETVQPSFRVNQSPQRDLRDKIDLSTPDIITLNKTSLQVIDYHRGPRLSLPNNPTIEISPPLRDEGVVQSDTETKRDEVHTSSEFMLVLYPNKKSKETEKQESFDLELEEALSPPPISFSSPDLGSEEQFLLEPPLRRSVSSTELLYERAMARFYEAVELEEASRAKRLNPTQEHLLREPTPIRKRLGSMTESERLSFERRSTLRRKLSGDVPDNLAALKLEFKEIITETTTTTTTTTTASIPLKASPRMVKKSLPIQHENAEEEDEMENDHHRDDNYNYGSDYTESTASSASEDSIEKFKNELIARTRSTSGELETYHPQRMEDPNFSPYRSPTPDQSIVVLNRPVPLPNPDFVPKPILKRPSSENSVKEETITNDKKQLSPEPIKQDINMKLEKPIEKIENLEKIQKTKETEKSPEKQIKLDKQEKSEKSPKPEKSEKSPKPEKSEKLPKPEKSPKLEKSLKKEKSPKPEKSPKSEKSSKLEKSEKPEKSEGGSSSIAKGIIGFFKRDKLPSDQALGKNGNSNQLEKDVQSKNGTAGAILTAQLERQKSAEEAQKKKLESSKSAEEEAKVVAEYYNDIVMELGSSRKNTVPIYMRGGQLNNDYNSEENGKVIDRKKSEAELEEELIEKYMQRPRLSIVERLQVAHVQDKSKSALEKPREEPKEKVKPAVAPVPENKVKEVSIENRGNFSPSEASEDNLSPRGSGDNLTTRGRKVRKPKAIKKRKISGSRSRNGSTSDLEYQQQQQQQQHHQQERQQQKREESGTRKRTGSRTRIRNESKSPGPLNRRPLKIEQPSSPPSLLQFAENRVTSQFPSLPAPYDGSIQTTSSSIGAEDITEEAQEKVRSTISYLTDVGLFIVACWVYIFKDARLVLPILALMVYRQLGEALKESIPDWIKRKKS